jgi:predicted MFS family arabinose efflux permease
MLLPTNNILLHATRISRKTQNILLKNVLPHNKKLNKSTQILLYGSSIWYLGEGMLGPILGVLTEKIGGNILEVSWIWATYLIAAGIFTKFVGKLSDKKFSKEKLLVAGYALNAVFTFSYLLASSTLHLLFVQVGLGIAAALAAPTWDALYAKHSAQEDSGYIWGLAAGQTQLTTGFAMILGGLIINYFSFNVLFIVMGVIQICATLYQAQILRKYL